MELTRIDERFSTLSSSHNPCAHQLGMTDFDDPSETIKDLSITPGGSLEKPEDASNTSGSPTANPEAASKVSESKPTKNGEASAEARAKGWVTPKGYDYAKYLTGEQGAKTTEKSGPVVVDEDGPEWAGIAAKYEWKAEYGDVGPPNPELEKMLFQSDLINRTGMKIAK